MNHSTTDLQTGKSSKSGSEKHISARQDSLFQQALNWHQKGDDRQALDLYQQVLDIDPDHAESCFYAALLHSDAGNHEKALPLFEKASNLQPSLPGIVYQLGICQYILGQNSSAIEAFEKVMQIDEEHWQAAYNLGAAYYEDGQISRAIEAYCLASRLNPQDTDIFFNLALAYKKAGDHKEAINSYCRAMEIEPDDPEIHYNLGRLYGDIGQNQEAIRSLEMAVAIRPDFGAALTNLGVLYSRETMRDKAISVYEKLIEINHNPTPARHILNALKGKTTDTAPIAYIKDLYDDFAGHFEKRLINDLCYNTPNHLVHFLEEQYPSKHSYPHMLDLGCGTGLCGLAFSHITNARTGVDLSRKMLAEAEKKDIYDQLIEDDIITFLESSSDSYDLIVAGDVLIYVGELESVFQLLPKRLAKQGKILFSTEHLDENGYKLMTSGRYAHSTSYINVLAHENNLQIQAVKTTKLRKEKDTWIDGEMYILVSCQE